MTGSPRSSSQLPNSSGVSTLIPVIAADHPRKLYDSGDQLQNGLWAVVSSDEQHDIKITPAHELRDVAPSRRQRPKPRKDPGMIKLLQECGRFSAQHRLPGRKDLIGWRSHERRC